MGADSKGRKLLKAIQQFNWDKARDLVSEGADLTVSDHRGWRAIHFAAEATLHSDLEERTDLVKSLINHGCDPNVPVEGTKQTAIIMAAYSGNFGLVRHLASLEVIDTDNCRDYYDWTVLHFVANKGTLADAEAILKGERGHILLGATNSEKVNPVVLAATRGNWPVVDYLISLKGDVGQTDNYNRSALHLAAKAGSLKAITEMLRRGLFPADCTMEDQGTALHLAARQGHVEVVRFFLERTGIRLNLVNDNRQTPFLTAASKKQWETAFFILDWFAENPDSAGNRGGDAAGEVNRQDANGFTALHYAARSGSEVAVRELLSRNANPEAELFESTCTPVVLAAVFQQWDIVKFLAFEYKNVEIAGHTWGPTGDTVAHYAARANDTLILDRLISEREAPVTTRNNLGETVITVLCNERQFDKVEKLLHDGAARVVNYEASDLDMTTTTTVNITSARDVGPLAYPADTTYTQGSTAMHLCAREGFLFLARALMLHPDQGAALSIRDKAGRTPKELATDRGNLGIVEVIEGAVPLRYGFASFIKLVAYVVTIAQLAAFPLLGSVDFGFDESWDWVRRAFSVFHVVFELNLPDLSDEALFLIFLIYASITAGLAYYIWITMPNDIAKFQRTFDEVRLTEYRPLTLVFYTIFYGAAIGLLAYLWSATTDNTIRFGLIALVFVSLTPTSVTQGNTFIDSVLRNYRGENKYQRYVRIKVKYTLFMLMEVLGYAAATVLFIPTTKALVSVYDCTASGPTSWTHDTRDIPCFQGTHLLQVAITSVVGPLFLVWLVRLVRVGGFFHRLSLATNNHKRLPILGESWGQDVPIVREEDLQSIWRKDLLMRRPAETVFFFTKIVYAASTILLTTYSRSLSVLNLVLALFMFLATVYYPYYYQPRMNHITTGLYAFIVWTNIVTAMTAFGSSVAVTVFAGVSLIFMGLGYLLSKMTLNKFGVHTKKHRENIKKFEQSKGVGRFANALKKSYSTQRLPAPPVSPGNVESGLLAVPAPPSGKSSGKKTSTGKKKKRRSSNGKKGPKRD